MNCTIPASYLALMKNDKILLLRRCNTGYEDGNYSMVAWHVEIWETFTQCMVREAKEEAWITIDFDDLKVAHVMNRDSKMYENNQRVDVFFVAKKWEWEITNMEPNKCSDLSWFDLDNIPENTIPCVKRAIENIRNWVFYSEYGWE